MIPQIILVGLMMLSLGVNLAKHGQPREDNYNFFITLVIFAIWMTLLYLGGFFN